MAEKALVRQTVLGFLAKDELDPTAARQLSVLLSKLARHDWPSKCPGLFEALVQSLQSGRTALGFRQTLFTLHCVLKELGSKRLISDKRNFLAAASELLPFVRALCQERTGSFLQDHQAARVSDLAPADRTVLLARLEEAAAIVKLAFKCASRLVSNGAEPRGGGEAAGAASAAFVAELLPVLQRLVECRQSLPGQGVEALGRAVDACIKKVVRIVVDAQQQFPVAFSWPGAGPSGESLLAVFVPAFYHVVMQCEAPADDGTLEPFFVHWYVPPTSRLGATSVQTCGVVSETRLASTRPVHSSARSGVADLCGRSCARVIVAGGALGLRPWALRLVHWLPARDSPYSHALIVRGRCLGLPHQP